VLHGDRDVRCVRTGQLARPDALVHTAVRNLGLRSIRGFATAAAAATSNVTPGILSKVGKDLHRRQGHPIATLKGKIEGFFARRYTKPDGRPLFSTFDTMPPFVTVKQNFDELLSGSSAWRPSAPRAPRVTASRSSRGPSGPTHDRHVLPGRKHGSQTPRIGKRLRATHSHVRARPHAARNAQVLRTHTSAHQTELLRSGQLAFLATGDCYRRDEIDSSHYPVFHQMEGVRVFSAAELAQAAGPRREDQVQFVREDLKTALSGAVKDLFGKELETRWVDAYFPFTEPSLEMEVLFRGAWMELLGCGVIQKRILQNCGVDGEGWAFGIGLERVAMALFDIPDIRLFWSDDARFVDQFRAGEITTFKPFSKYPEVLKDITFWVPAAFHENDFYALVRGVAGDLVEQVRLVDKFTHPKTGRDSRCFRITYRSMERTLTNKEIDELQFRVRAEAQKEGYELR
jgi:phenylalanyl-tRNA synthetase alpha chain